MKNKKLNALLNKVVEFNKSDALHFKGFLYWNYNGYHIKVVEVIGDANVIVNGFYWLKDGEEEYITHAEKPKLMRVSMKSWHYRLIKFVLHSNAPTPKTMQNGCPYFWLLVFSLFACPFVALGKGLILLLALLPELLVWLLQKAFIAWLNSLEDATAYEYADKSKYSYSGRKILPLTVKTYFKLTDELAADEFMDYFLLEKYKLSPGVNKELYLKKKAELSEKWLAWQKELQEREKEREKIAREYRMKEQARIREWERRAEIRREKWDARMKPIQEGLNGIFKSIRQTFTFDVKFDWRFIIKRTKQFVGAIITLILLTATYFLINGIAFCIMVAADWCGSHWQYFAVIGMLLIIAGILYVLYIFVTGWVETIVDKYRGGKRIWYVEPVIYLIYYPVKYAVIAIAYGVFYIIWTPVKFIVYNFLWNLIISPVGAFLGKSLWRLICAFGRALKNSTGIFGEYFSASYTDYCPGLEWVDTEEDSTIYDDDGGFYL